jgi:hypothetical protein
VAGLHLSSCAVSDVFDDDTQDDTGPYRLGAEFRVLVMMATHSAEAAPEIHASGAARDDAKSAQWAVGEDLVSGSSAVDWPDRRHSFDGLVASAELSSDASRYKVPLAGSLRELPVARVPLWGLARHEERSKEAMAVVQRRELVLEARQEAVRLKRPPAD